MPAFLNEQTSTTVPRPDICNAVSQHQRLALSVILRELSAPPNPWCNGILACADRYFAVCRRF
ncbi:hypothetical protein FA95DRAFT_1559966 [Auriscalpium vulgare]|uniref:Uncharacterized protein n=1 Tax=Auriscalpium vulgare TaxID=40419 RepID=A0ACB8RRY7_9AGAM|nr:hypothetical protein FA95DRAFT_1559966 [Auriscalpium vulgare]